MTHHCSAASPELQDSRQPFDLRPHHAHAQVFESLNPFVPVYLNHLPATQQLAGLYELLVSINVQATR
jgi:hypothetical protein